MQIELLAFGKLKTPGLRETADYYLKLLRPWVNTSETEIKPVPVHDKNDREVILKKETQILQSHFSKPARSVIYLLDERGKNLSTLEWAKLFENHQNQSVQSTYFCIGSSLGFDAGLKSEATGLLSLGKQTVSHELARVLLLEQIYRAYSVLKGHPYHNP